MCPLKLKNVRCVPYNLFSGGLPGDAGIQAVIDGGQELQSYIANTTFILGTGEQRLFQAVVSGQSGISIPGAPGFHLSRPGI